MQKMPHCGIGRRRKAEGGVSRGKPEAPNSQGSQARLAAKTGFLSECSLTRETAAGGKFSTVYKMQTTTEATTAVWEVGGWQGEPGGREHMGEED